MPSGPGIERLENRAQLPSKRQRVFDAHGHLREHLPFDKGVSLQLPQLLSKHFPRNPGHLGAQNGEAGGYRIAHQPPENYGLPTSADKDQEFLNGTQAGDAFGARFNVPAERVTRYLFGSWYPA